jgi:O-antigen/teichoic acid export membrane protein
MSPLQRLASQTAVYGVSSVVGRFLNYLLVPLLTYTFAPAEYGTVAELYAYMGFLGVLLVLGLETGYFRFRSDPAQDPERVYATALGTLAGVNGMFLALVLLALAPLAVLLRYADHPQYLVWCALILALDSVGALAFARLRAEQRALRFAGVKLLEIGVNVALCLLLIVYCREAHGLDPGSLAGRLWRPEIGVGYVFLANLAASAVKLLLLAPELRVGWGGFDGALLVRMLRYSLPMVLIGFAGIVNEMLDRAALKYLLPYDPATNMAQLGIYSACYKLSILMSLFIQAFRYAGEPFFFAYAQRADARRTYAEVLRYFVIFSVCIFLLVTLYLDLFKYFIGAPYRVGLRVVPVLLLANLFLGIYVNLSVWYKLSDRTLLGAGVSLLGAGITVVLLLWWVPVFGYLGAAWATLVCYASMALVSYLLGRRFYPVPYDLGRVLGYLLLGLGIYVGCYWTVRHGPLPGPIVASLGMLLFLAVAWRLDGRRLWGRGGAR